MPLVFGCSPGTYPCNFLTDGRINASGDCMLDFVFMINLTGEFLQKSHARLGLLVLRMFLWFLWSEIRLV